MVQEEKIFFWSVFVTAAISRRLNKTTTLMNFRWFKFFNTCEALASLSVNRFGCGFFLGFTFFTEQVPDSESKTIRHTLREELTVKLNIIWWSIKIIFERIFPGFFQCLSMWMSSLRLFMIIMTGLSSFGYISSW